MDRVLEVAFEFFFATVGVGGFDEVIDESKEEGAVTRAHEFLGGVRFLLAPVVGQAAFVVALFTFARTEGFFARGWDPVTVVAHGRSVGETRRECDVLRGSVSKLLFGGSHSEESTGIGRWNDQGFKVARGDYGCPLDHRVRLKIGAAFDCVEISGNGLAVEFTI